MIERIHKEGFQTRNDLNYFLTELKESESWLYSYHSKMLQMISTQVAGAQKTLKEMHKKGYKTGQLSFARFDNFLTFTYSQSGFGIAGSKLYLSNIGKIQIICHRQIQGHIKQVIITKSKSGKWHAYITIDIDVDLPKIQSDRMLGIDVGIKNFAYDSVGHVTPNLLNLKQMLKPLARVQRKILRRQMGSQNRKKAVRWYQIIHERITNRRKNFLHKLSTQYAKNHGIVFVEKLQKLNMVKNKKLARNIMDSGWGIFVHILQYKTNVIEVSPYNTSIDCSGCGTSISKTLTVRTHICHICSLVIDRDHNAAINILQKGLEILKSEFLQSVRTVIPQELREVMPVEILMKSRKQEETIVQIQ
jgi:putative transposase